MAFSFQQKRRHQRARREVMLDMIQAQHAPIKDPDQLYAAVRQAVIQLGLPETDANWFYHKMQRDQWRFGGVPLLDWQQTVQSFHTHKFFPSQRKAP